MNRPVSIVSRARKLVLLSILAATGFLVSGTEAADFSTWAHHKNITLNTGTGGVAITANVTNFPVLVRLTNNNFTFSEAQPNGADIRFAKTNNDALSYQIESWDATNQKAAIWVKVDTVYKTNATQHIVMYWGASTGASTPSLSNAATVFDTLNGFAGVWHLNEDPTVTAPQIKNSTGISTINGTCGGALTAASSVTGLIGLSIAFDSTDNIEIPNDTALNFDSTKSFTISLWNNTTDIFGQTVNKKDSVCTANVFEGETLSTDCQYTYDTVTIGRTTPNIVRVLTKSDAFSVAGDRGLAGESWLGLSLGGWGERTPNYGGVGHNRGINDGLWHLITIVVKRPLSVLVYSNDSLAETKEDFPATCASSSNIIIGAALATHYYRGNLDEVRIDRVARDSNWVSLCYNSQKVNQKLVQVEGEIPVSVLFNGHNGKPVAWNKDGRINKALVQLFNMRGCKVYEKVVGTSVLTQAFYDISSVSEFSKASLGVYMMKISTIDQKSILANRKVMISRR